MKISIIPKRYGEKLSNNGLKGIPQPYRDSLVDELKTEDISLEIQEVNYGRGSDWIWILVTIIAGYKIIVEGDKIDKGLNGWNNIYKKLKKFLKRSKSTKLDNDVLLLIAVSEVFKANKEITEVDFIKKVEIDIIDNSEFFPNRSSTEFISKDDLYTIFVFKSDLEVYYVVGIRITGEFDFLKTIRANSFP